MANLQSLLPSTACLTAILRTTKYSLVGVTSSQETHDTATTINMLLHKMHCTGCTCPVLHNGARPFLKSYLNSYASTIWREIVIAIKIAPRARTTYDVNKIKMRLQKGFGFIVHRLATLCRPWLALCIPTWHTVYKIVWWMSTLHTALHALRERNFVDADSSVCTLVWTKTGKKKNPFSPHPIWKGYSNKPLALYRLHTI